MFPMEGQFFCLFHKKLLKHSHKKASESLRCFDSIGWLDELLSNAYYSTTPITRAAAVSCVSYYSACCCGCRIRLLMTSPKEILEYCPFRLNFFQNGFLAWYWSSAGDDDGEKLVVPEWWVNCRWKKRETEKLW